MMNCLLKGRKQCEKWRKCCLAAFSLFRTMFSKGLPERHQKFSLCAKGLNPGLLI